MLREAREADHRARRRARKDARRAERIRGAARGPHRPPWPVALLLSIFFAVGMVAVAIATQVVVPGILRLLSIFFATRGLTAAADAVREAGEDAMAGMARSRQWIRAGLEPDGEPGERRERRCACAWRRRLANEREKVRVDSGED